MKIMIKRFAIFALILPLIACSSLEKQTYQVIVGAKAFIDAEKKAHPECAPGLPYVMPVEQGRVCEYLSKATAAKDSMIDALEVYCAGPQFENGGQCQTPQKNSPAFEQASDKLRAALVGYQQAETDLKGVLK